MTPDRLFLWIIFNIFVLGMLTVDLGVYHRKAHAVTTREATTWCLVWVTLAILFNAGIYIWLGSEKALEFFTGYLIEYSLSVDNIFVFILIFSYFAVPASYQYRVLFWGILGALVMRGAFIGTGAFLLQHFHWVIYIFGAFLVFTGIKMLVKEETTVRPEDNPVIKLLRRLMPLLQTTKVKAFCKTEPKMGSHASVRCPFGRRKHRPHLCRRLGTGHLRREPRPIHCLHLEHICHPGPSIPLFFVGGSHRSICLPTVRVGRGAWVRGYQDAAR
jgi:TerC family integral membrane protein